VTGDFEKDDSRAFGFARPAQTAWPGIVQVRDKQNFPAASARCCRTKTFRPGKGGKRGCPGLALPRSNWGETRENQKRQRPREPCFGIHWQRVRIIRNGVTRKHHGTPDDRRKTGLRSAACSIINP